MSVCVCVYIYIACPCVFCACLLVCIRLLHVHAEVGACRCVHACVCLVMWPMKLLQIQHGCMPAHSNHNPFDVTIVQSTNAEEANPGPKRSVKELRLSVGKPHPWRDGRRECACKRASHQGGHGVKNCLDLITPQTPPRRNRNSKSNMWCPGPSAHAAHLRPGGLSFIGGCAKPLLLICNLTRRPLDSEVPVVGDVLKR